jgi:thioredoxin 1
MKNIPLSKITLIVCSLLLYILLQVGFTHQKADASKRVVTHEYDEDVYVNALITIKNADEFNEHVLNNGEVAIVEFYSDWCSYCRKMAPILNDFALNNNEKFSVYIVNKDYMRDISQKYEIFGIPTLIVFVNGNELDRHSGFLDYDQLQLFITKTLNKN